MGNNTFSGWAAKKRFLFASFSLRFVDSAALFR